MNEGLISLPDIEPTIANLDHYLLRRCVGSVRSLDEILNAGRVKSSVRVADILTNVRMVPLLPKHYGFAATFNDEVPTIGRLGYATVPLHPEDINEIAPAFAAGAQGLGIDVTNNPTLLRIGFTENIPSGCLTTFLSTKRLGIAADMYQIAFIDTVTGRNLRVLKHGDGKFEIVLADDKTRIAILDDPDLERELLIDLSHFLSDVVEYVRENKTATNDGFLNQ